MIPDCAAEREPLSTDDFENILVVLPADGGDEDSLRSAAELARRAKARLSALMVVDLAGETERLARFAGDTSDAIETRIISDHRAALDELVARVAPDAPIERLVRIGKPFLETIRDVLQRGRDLVIKQAAEPGGLHRFFFTSTDQHLLRKCPCPVWLRARDQSGPTRSVLAAVDVDQDAAGEPETQAALNAAILKAARSIAAFERAELHVVHVWEAPAETLVRRWGDRDGGAERYVRETEAEHRYALESLVTETFGDARVQRGVRVTPHLARGEPRAAIPEAIQDCGADILVMGTVARTGVPGLIIGNTAEDVLNSTDCSVVTVKPPGYRSPIVFP